jgi:hypothetical protein
MKTIKALPIRPTGCGRYEIPTVYEDGDNLQHVKIETFRNYEDAELFYKLLPDEVKR